MTDSNIDLGRVAAAFDQDTDPLAQYEAQFEEIDIDPLDAYLQRVQIPNNASEATLDLYQYAFDQWRDFMHTSERHFACPNDSHIKEFMQHLTDERDNCARTITAKVRRVNRAYEWWQEHHAFPHPVDYNPFRLAIRETNLENSTDEMKHPRLTTEDLRAVVRKCTNIRERLFLIFQLKFGLRVGELLNIRLEDIALSNSEIKRWYSELGSAEPIEEHDNAIYIPSRHNRKGNKSHRPRILPLDDEVKQVLVQYLPTRPTVEESWLILGQRTYEKMDRGYQVNAVWREYFSEYNDSEHYRDITSHYGRYYFTNYWKLQQSIPRELVQYMRGDKLGNSSSNESIDEYLNTFYADIEDLYLENIFKLF